MHDGADVFGVTRMSREGRLDYDIAIVGGGPVGLAAAIHARRHGLSAIVLDCRSSPREKACGEGIMPRGRGELRDMGVRLAVADAASFVGIRFVDGECVAEARFASGAGLGVARTTLWQALAERAADLGVEIALGERVEDWRWSGSAVDVLSERRRLRARLLIGADGLHSSVRKRAGLEKPTWCPRRYGMRRHFEVAPWSPYVEVHWDDMCEAYVTPVGPTAVGVALLWKGGGQRFAELLQRFPRLGEHLAGARPLDRVRGAGPFSQRARSRVAPGVALVGDAAGYVDPLTGEGLSLGFTSARILIEGFARGADPAEYERAYRNISRLHVHSTRLLLAIAARPALRRRVVRAMARNPDLFAKFLAVNAGEHNLRDLRFADVLRVVGGVLQ